MLASSVEVQCCRTFLLYRCKRLYTSIDASQPDMMLDPSQKPPEPLPVISSAEWDELQRLADEQQDQQHQQPSDVRPLTCKYTYWLANVVLGFDRKDRVQCQGVTVITTVARVGWLA